MKKISFRDNYIAENRNGKRYILLKEADFKEFDNVSEFILDKEGKRGFRKYKIVGFGQVFSKEIDNEEIDTSLSLSGFFEELNKRREEADKFKYMYVKSAGYFKEEQEASSIN